MDARDAHRYFSKSCFNDAWNLMAKKDWSQADLDTMMHLAHASVFHWSRRADCTDQNLSIGYWQLSRVYALAGMGESALHFGNTCLSYSQQYGVAPAYLGYAYEALARANSVIKNVEQAEYYQQLARELAITLPEADKVQLLADLDDLN